jgi:hypothetical protein
MKNDATKDDTNKSREPVKEPKESNFADRLASLSDSQLKGLAKIVNDEVKDRAGKNSVLGTMSDSEFSALKSDLLKSFEADKKKGVVDGKR